MGKVKKQSKKSVLKAQSARSEQESIRKSTKKPRSKSKPAKKKKKSSEIIPPYTKKGERRKKKLTKTEEKARREEIKPKRRDDGTYEEGSSGNPNGRPKGKYSMTVLLRDMLSSKRLYQRKTVGQELLEAAIKHAKKGDFRFFQECINRIDGKVADHLKIGNGDDVLDRIPTDILEGILDDKAKDKKGKSDKSNSSPKRKPKVTE